jgi:hypothetical protein
MRTMARFFSILMAGAALFAALPSGSEAAPTAAEITGEIERLTLNNPTDVYSGGVMIVGGTQVILPKNLLLDLPANRLTLQQLFSQAPAACRASGESGLAKADRCNTMGAGGFATLSGVHSTAGNVIAGDVLIEKGKETAFGVVSFISYSDGYFRLNGVPGDPNTGVMVRLNDPTSRHTVQQGLGCAAGGANCSPDPRFGLDPDNYVNTFSTGYPFCIPSTVSRSFPGLPAGIGLQAIAPRATSANASGNGDLLCPSTNRTPGVVVEPDVADSRRFAPILPGDSVKSEGNYESVNGVRFLSAHTTRINRALSTKNLPDQPDYLFLEEVFLEAPGFQNQRARMLIIGFSTLATPATDVDFWTIHRDPVSNAPHEFPLASIQGCDNAAGAGSCSSQGLIGAGGNIFRIRYDVDFLLAVNDTKGRYPGGARNDLNPCWQLLNSPRFTLSNPGLCPGASAGTTTGAGITLANNFGIMLPAPHEIQARTGHLLDNPGLAGSTIDVNGAPATNGQYLFPFGINLGGTETADFLEVDINLLDTPRIFEGLPWSLDRRLAPSGCLKAGGCEATPQPLDPFPYTGLDPRLQAEFLVAGQAGGTPKGAFNDPNYTQSLLSNASNRVFSYVRGTPFAGGRYNFDGNNTLLPCATGNCPAPPGLIPIAATPFLSIFPPIADEDAAATSAGVAVNIDVLANDIAILGSLNPASVKIAAAPSNGSTLVNPVTGVITYTPTLAATGTISFSYTVASDIGAVSLPGTVSVAILAPPKAFNDSASAAIGSVKEINLTGNDLPGSGVLNIASVLITSAPSCGQVVNQGDGSVLFSAPLSIPAAPGTCSFSYTVRDASVPPLVSNSATVTVAITPALTIVATPDFAATSVGAPVVIPVLANDNASGSPPNPATVSASAASGGNASANLDGTVTYTPPAAVGIYTFSYTVKNSAVPPTTSNAATVSVTVTDPVPTGSIAINGGAALTGNPAVNLTLASTSLNGAVTQMQFSTDGVNFSAPEPYATSKALTLPAGDGTKTVTVRYLDTLGKVSANIAASILLDTTAPLAGTVVVNGGLSQTISSVVNLVLSATDSNGVLSMQFSLDGVNFSAPEPYANVKVLDTLPGDGLKTITTRFLDSAGNLSAPVVRSITLTTVPISGNVIINGGATLTGNSAASLAISASSTGTAITQMQFSWDGVTWTALEAFAATRTVSLLTTPGNGLKTLYTRFRTSAGTLSAPVVRSITLLDNTLPTGTIAFNPAAPTRSNSGTLALTAADSTGVPLMQLSHDGVTYTALEPFVTTRAVSLPIIGVNTIWVIFKDGVGNLSLPISASITRNP